jgi:hypothetical protein
MRYIVHKLIWGIFILTTSLVISLSNILANIMQKNKVYCIPVGDPVNKREVLKSHEHYLTTPHFCACHKPGLGIPTSYIVVFYVFSER